MASSYWLLAASTEYVIAGLTRNLLNAVELPEAKGQKPKAITSKKTTLKYN